MFEQRIDSKDKVTGRAVFPSDQRMDDMLWVEVVRSPMPHAKIQSIDVNKAEAVEGVVRVLTAEHVPGINAFGIQVQDMPVLCRDRVRFVGDAIALVGAYSKQQARLAASKVRISLEELEPLCDPLEAMQPSAVALHPSGNIMHEGHFQKGDCSLGFDNADVVIERDYQLQMMDHAFMETEAGLSYYDDDGLLTVESCGQYVYRDRMQIARALGLPVEKVRVITRMVGGAFGGKDEITVQIQIALMTYHTGKPAKLVLSRPESIISHTKRHPVKIWHKTGVSKSGKLTALEARFVSDTGAYASLGGAVLDVMMEHAAGPYLVPNVKIDGYAVYTNNGFSGAFRGFGCTQAACAMESQMDLMAKELGIDPLRFRLQNVLNRGDLTGVGGQMEDEVGAKTTLRAAREGELYTARRRLKKGRSVLNKHKAALVRRGIGVATTMKSCGMGAGVVDTAKVQLDLCVEGRITVRVSSTEMGQGCHTVFGKLIAQSFGLPSEQIVVVHADTSETPDSGPTSASRTTHAVSQALLLAANELKSSLDKLIRKRLGPIENGFELRGSDVHTSGHKIALIDLVDPGGISASSTYAMPETEMKLAHSMPHKLFGFATHVCLVQVNTSTGEISVEAVEAYIDGGKVVFQSGFEGQSEGGVAQGIGYALFEEVLLKKGRFLTTNFDTYVLPSSLDVPMKIRTVAIESGESLQMQKPKGVGELVTVGIAPAILNAIDDAVGIRFTKLPVRPEQLLQALEAKKT